MLGAIVTSIGAGQWLTRTGRYKVIAIVGFIVAVIGMLLLRGWASPPRSAVWPSTWSCSAWAWASP